MAEATSIYTCTSDSKMLSYLSELGSILKKLTEAGKPKKVRLERRKEQLATLIEKRGLEISKANSA